MREAAFIKQNREKWESYENESDGSADELAERYIELTDDLSYASTFYPGSNVSRYLNDMTRDFHHRIYRNKGETFQHLLEFWTRTVPLTVYANHKLLRNTFFIFLVSCCIGWLSASQDDTYIRLILGDFYVNKTIENIEAGEPMAIYSSASQHDMFFAITLNNITVSFYAFIMGLLLSVGTLFMMMQNGIMLGAFQYLFYKHKYLLICVLTVWIHGVLEISSIIVAGAAGFRLGNGIIFPSTYSRLESFKRGAVEGLTLVAGCIPLFIIAGFLESFVTRHSTVSLHVSASIILISIAFIYWYFIYYPIQLHKKITSNA